MALRKSLPGISLTQGETLTLNLRADAGAAVVVTFAGASSQTASGTADVDGKLTLTLATGAWTPGEYVWEEIQTTTTGTVSMIELRRLTLRAPLSSIAAGTDIRSLAEITVAMLQASLSGSQTAEVQLYRINNRELRRYPIQERLQLLNFWQLRLQRERRKAAGISGLGPRLQTRI